MSEVLKKCLSCWCSVSEVLKKCLMCVCVFAQGGREGQHEVLHRPYLLCGAVGAGDGQADPGEQVRAQQETRATQGKVPISLLLMARSILVGMD